MKRSLLVLGLLLAACTQSTGQAFLLTIDEKDAAKRTELVEASARVIDRRLGAMGDKLLNHSATGTGSNVVLNVVASSTGALAKVTDQLKTPFDLQFMKESTEADADIVIANHGGFKATGITEKDLEWATESMMPDKMHAQIELAFTPDGMEKMKTVFKENQRKYIGLFVRKKLISNILVDGEAPPKILITGIPTEEIAQTFADDVNVGLHVTFSAK